MLRIEIHPEAIAEIIAARDWYELHATNLGNDFIKEVDSAIETIDRTPGLWTRYFAIGNVRRFLIHRFPFAIVYRHDEEKIQILAVSHLRRRPGYWKTRLSA